MGHEIHNVLQKLLPLHSYIYLIIIIIIMLY